MRYLVLKIIFRCLADAKLPELKGSTLRGAFGRALHDLVCSSDLNGNCSVCNKSDGCAFYHMFYAEQSFTSSAKNSPRPYVFRSENRNCNFYAGDLLEAEIVLFGKFADWTEVVIQSMVLAAYRGFGVGRQRFDLHSAVIVAPGGKKISVESYVTEEMCFNIMPPQVNDIENRKNVFFEMITPVNVNKRSFSHLFDAEFFLNSYIRRISSLSRYWGDNDWAKFSFKDYFKELRLCKILSTNIRWMQTSRYSLTQSKKFPIAGFVGNFSISNIPVSLMESLTHLENIHIGKGTAWGMGHVKTIGFF